MQATERISGVTLKALWSSFERADKTHIIEQIGAAMASAHAAPVGVLTSLDPEWNGFIREQRARCKARHASHGMPAWLIDHVDELIGAQRLEVDPSERVILTGEYTPSNLLVERDARGWQLSGMIDFADAMVGRREYDLLGPSLFSCEGDPVLVAALFRGYYGAERRINHAFRMQLLALALLHRFANFDDQIRIPHWRDRVSSLEQLAVLIWPEL